MTNLKNEFLFNATRQNNPDLGTANVSCKEKTLTTEVWPNIWQLQQASVAHCFRSGFSTQQTYKSKKSYEYYRLTTSLYSTNNEKYTFFKRFISTGDNWHN